MFVQSLPVLWTVLAVGLALPSEHAHVKVFRQDRSLFGNYHAEVKAFDKTHKLQLKAPGQSIFSPDFKLTILQTDDKGNNVFIDKTPTKKELENAERNIYVDPEALAAVRIHSEGGNLRLTGVIDGMVITHEDGRHVATKIADSSKRASDYVDLNRNTSIPPKQAKFFPGTARFNDVIDLPRNLSQTPDGQSPSPKSSRAVTTANPEVAIVFDNHNYQTFKGNTTAMTNYLSLFFHSINNRYANVDDPKITLTVTGLTAVSSTSGQPFIENSKTATTGDAYDINKILDSFALWTFSQGTNVAKHDLMSLITGVHLQSKNSNGQYEDGVAGLAYLRAACWVDTNGKKDLSTSVSGDARGYYGGINTVAHELAHNLGSPHDGQKDSNAAYDTSSCPWSDGYIMSYEGYGKKSKFYFSSCSKTQMKNFLDTPAASCTKSSQSTTKWTEATLNGGDYMNMTTQCQLSLQKPKAYVDNTKSPSELCQNLACRYPDDANPNSIYIVSTNAMPADYSYCGDGGSCINGDCIVQPNMTAQCRTALKDNTANFDSSKTSSNLCQNLVCRFTNGTTVDLKRPAIDHCPCGTKGRCIENKCNQPVIVIPANMTVQCQKALNKPKAYVDPTKTGDELCSNLVCRYPADDNSGSVYIATLNRRPEDYTPCGTNNAMNCDNGKCVKLNS